MICLKLFSFTNLIQALIVWERFMLLRSHRENNIVNFNDAFARIDRIEKSDGTKVYYGDLSNFSISISEEEALNYRAVILRPVNGLAILFNSTNYFILRNGKRYPYKHPDFNYGAMTNEGFWRFQSIRGPNNFALVGFTSLPKSGGDWEWETIIQSIPIGKGWKFIQEFEWKDDLFACFERTDDKLVVLRLKRAPENSTLYGTFISSFFVDSTIKRMAYFLPSYPDPIMYYSKREENGTLFFNALELKDAIKMSDQGFRRCKETDKYPRNFFKLRPFIRDVTIKDPVFKPGQCKKDIPCFQLTKSIQCFQLPKNILNYHSVDIYTVGLNFKARILSFINGSSDVRCDLRDCKKVMASCKSEEIQFENREIVSTFWNFETFTLTRWDKTGLLGQFRLLDCHYFPTCSLCTLYGAFNCEWANSSCVKADDPTTNGHDLCYSNVVAYRKSLSNDTMELAIQLPHKLDPKGGEEAFVMLDEQVYSDVKYTGKDYIVVTWDEDPLAAMIIIKRGAYTMNTTLILEKKPPVTDILVLLIILAVVVVITILYCIFRCRKRESIESSQPAPLNIKLVKLPPVVRAGKFGSIMKSLEPMVPPSIPPSASPSKSSSPSSSSRSASRSKTPSASRSTSRSASPAKGSVLRTKSSD